MGRETTGAARVRALLEKAGGPAKGRGVGYGEAARREAVAYARARMVEGGTLYGVAREVGVRALTLGRWLERGTTGFAEITIASEPSSIVLVSPTGWRVEGLDIATLRQLVGGAR